MTNMILTDHIASISDLKSNPMATIRSAEGKSIAILNRNQPAFYAVPTQEYERMIEIIEDIELMKMINDRKDQEEIEVSLDEL